MRILTIVHEADAGPGVFGEVAAAQGHELHPWLIADGERCPEQPSAYDAVLTLGGAMDADEDERHPWLAQERGLLVEFVQARRPVLGVCLGAQILASAADAATSRLPEPEIGWYDVRLTDAGRSDPLLGPLGSTFAALQWHSCQFSLPAQAEPLAASERCLQAYRLHECAWGIQFHAEVTLADFEGWLDHHAAHPDVDGPAEPEALRDATRDLMAGWNALGRGLFGRFLDQVAVALAASTTA